MLSELCGLNRYGRKLFSIALMLLLTMGVSSALYADAQQDEIKIKKASYQVKKNLIKVKGTLAFLGDKHSDKSDKSQKSKKSKKSKKGKKSNKSKKVSIESTNTNIVELWDADLGVRLAVVESDDRKFEFKYLVAGGTTAPCNVEVRALGFVAIRGVKHAPSDCGQYQLNLSGTVTDAPIPFATVTVTVNGQSYTTVADENGAYSLDVLSSSVEALLLIEASATNPQTGDPINFISLAGSFSRVLSDPVANVTNVTTANFILAVEANGGTAPTTTAELQSAETSIDATALLELAAVIKLIVDDPRFSLPAGTTNLIDFVADSSAVDVFKADVASVDATALADTQTAIIQDSNLVAGFVAADIPSRYFAISAAEPGYMARRGSAIEFDTSNNTGRVLAFNGNGIAINDAFTWAVNNGRLEVTYSNVIAREQLTFSITDVTEDQAEIDAYNAGGGADGGINYFTSVVQRNYTRVVDGTLVDIISTEERSEFVTAPFILSDGTTLTIANPRIVINVNNELFRSAQDIVNVPFTTSCLAGEVCALGVWGGVYHYAAGTRVFDEYVYPETSYGEVINFAGDGTTTGVMSNRTANWQLDANGNLVISYTDGWVQTLTIIDNIGIEYGVFSSFDNGTDSYASYNLWVRGDTSFQLDENYLLPSQPNKYWNGEVNSWVPGSFDANGLHVPDVRFGWKFATSGVVDNYYVDFFTDFDGDGITDLGLAITHAVDWSATSGIVEINRFSFAKRNWFPIAATTFNGDRMFYVLEKEDRDAALWYGGAPGFRPLFPPRINIEREISEFTDWDFTSERGPF